MTSPISDSAPPINPRRLIAGAVLAGVAAMVANGLAIAIFVTRTDNARRENCENVAEAFDTFTEILVATSAEANPDRTPAEQARADATADLFRDRIHAALGTCS